MSSSLLIFFEKGFAKNADPASRTKLENKGVRPLVGRTPFLFN
jgi:hypothetical protein